MDTSNPNSGSGWSGPPLPGLARQPGDAFCGRRSTLVLGASGTGKTVFALQALVSAAREGEPGVFVAIGQPPEALEAVGRGFGWDLPKLQAQRLLVIHACSGAQAPGVIVTDVLPLAASLRATRVALDSLHLARLPLGTADQMREMLQVR